MCAREEGRTRRLGVGYCNLVLGLCGHAVRLGEACRSGLRLRLGGGLFGAKGGRCLDGAVGRPRAKYLHKSKKRIIFAVQFSSRMRWKCG